MAQCEHPYYGDPLDWAQDGRILPEVIFKTLSLQVTSLIAVGHLSSLRDSSEHSAVFDIIGFLVLPLLPIMTLVTSAYASLRKALKDYGSANPEPLPKSWATFWKLSMPSFYLNCALGLWASTPNGNDDRAPLLDVDARSWQREPKSSRKWRWWARLSILLVYNIQAAGVIFYWVRRWQHGTANILDHHNGVIAVGGSCAGLISIVILVQNFKWTFQHPGFVVPEERKANNRVQGKGLQAYFMVLGLQRNIALYMSCMSIWILRNATDNVTYGFLLYPHILSSSFQSFFNVVPEVGRDALDTWVLITMWWNKLFTYVMFYWLPITWLLFILWGSIRMLSMNRVQDIVMKKVSFALLWLALATEFTAICSWVAAELVLIVFTLLDLSSNFVFCTYGFHAWLPNNVTWSDPLDYKLWLM